MEELGGLFERVPLEIQPWLGPGRLPFYDQCQLRRAVKQQAIDVFYTPYFDAPLGLDIPVVVTMCDAVHFRYSTLYPWKQRAYYQMLMRRHGRTAASILTISNFSKGELIELVGIPPDKIHVAYLSLPSNFIPSVGGLVAAEFRRRNRLPEKYVLYAGGSEVRKNIKNLLIAYRLWIGGTDGVPPLVLTGDVERYLPYRSDINALGANVCLPGRVSDQEMPMLYAGAVASVYPSLYEGFGLPLIEAMACEVPIVCSNVSCIPEIARDAGLYFEPSQPDQIAEALDAVTKNESLRISIVANGKRRLADFSLAKTVAVFERVILGAKRILK